MDILLAVRSKELFHPSIDLARLPTAPLPPDQWWMKKELTPSSTHSQILRAPLPSKPSLAALPFTPSPNLVPSNYTSAEPTGEVNRFKVRAGQSLQEWEKAGWIWSGDPRGWAEWYCRFWGGRRCGDDERQVRRCTLCLLCSLFFFLSFHSPVLFQVRSVYCGPWTGSFLGRTGSCSFYH